VSPVKKQETGKDLTKTSGGEESGHKLPSCGSVLDTDQRRQSQSLEVSPVGLENQLYQWRCRQENEKLC